MKAFVMHLIIHLRATLEGGNFARGNFRVFAIFSTFHENWKFLMLPFAKLNSNEINEFVQFNEIVQFYAFAKLVSCEIWLDKCSYKKNEARLLRAKKLTLTIKDLKNISFTN